MDKSLVVLLIGLMVVAVISVAAPLRAETTRKLLIGMLVALGLFFCAAVTGPLRTPPDDPARPLTAAQLAQRPLLVYPGSTRILVARETRTYGPDEPRPKRSRYSRRSTTFEVEGTNEQILAYYRQLLFNQGWVESQECDRSSSPSPAGAFYRRSCKTISDESISIHIATQSPGFPLHEITVTEILPTPLEWPDPPQP